MMTKMPYEKPVLDLYAIAARDILTNESSIPGEGETETEDFGESPAP